MAIGNNEPNDTIDCASTWGDLVESDDEGEVEDTSEPVERYEQGLYHPICIGKVLTMRYRIEHKLGHGGFSTVWMAYDMLKHKDVALKILTTGDSGKREYTMQGEIISANVMYGLAPFKTSTTIGTKYQYLGHPRKCLYP